jgi:hypothetical protein
MGHFPFPGHEQGYLSLYFEGDGGYLASQLSSDDLTAGYSSVIDFLKMLQLAGFQAARFAINLVYRSLLMRFESCMNNIPIIKPIAPRLNLFYWFDGFY